MSPVRARDRTMRIPLTVGLLVASIGVGFPVGAQQVCRPVTPEGRAAVVEVLRTRQTTLVAAYGLSGTSPDSLRALRDSADADRCRELNRYLGFPVVLWRLGDSFLASETDSVRAASGGLSRQRSQPELFVYREGKGFRYLPGEPPPLRGAFARFVPPVLRESLVCDPPNAPVDSAVGPQPPGLFCTATRLFTARDEPYLAMITLNAAGAIEHMTISWNVRARPGEDTVRGAVLDSAHAEAEARLIPFLGPPVRCGNVPFWRTEDGLVVLTPPQRGRGRYGDWTDRRQTPQFGYWALVVRRGWFEECDPKKTSRASP